jgi:hypothetical protein
MLKDLRADVIADKLREQREWIKASQWPFFYDERQYLQSIILGDRTRNPIYNDDLHGGFLRKMTSFYVKIVEQTEPNTFRIDEQYRESVLHVLTNLEIESDAILGNKYSKDWRNSIGKP